MKKALLLLSIVLAHSAFALPIVCESYEKTKEISTLRVKINPEVRVQVRDKIWNLYLLGITPQDGTPFRHRMYSSGVIRPESISMTVVKDEAVFGYINAKSEDRNGVYEGQIRIGGILRGRVIGVRCHDEEIHGQM